MYELKIYRGAVCHGNEEWYKVWRWLDLLVQNWHEEFDEFWSEHLKISKNLYFNGLPLTKVYNVWLKKSTERLCLIAVKIDAKLKENWLVLSKMTWRVWQIFNRARSKVWNLEFLLGPFIQSRKCMSLKFTGELCFMRMKNDAKFEEDLTCQFKIGMRNLTNSESSTWKIQKFAL